MIKNIIFVFRRRVQISFMNISSPVSPTYIKKWSFPHNSFLLAVPLQAISQRRVTGLGPPHRRLKSKCGLLHHSCHRTEAINMTNNCNNNTNTKITNYKNKTINNTNNCNNIYLTTKDNWNNVTNNNNCKKITNNDKKCKNKNNDNMDFTNTSMDFNSNYINLTKNNINFKNNKYKMDNMMRNNKIDNMANNNIHISNPIGLTSMVI